MKRNIAIVGAGIFGLTAAIKVAEKGYPVTIFEKNRDIFSSASGINQYRLHRGYHYPRGIATAQDCKRCVEDFYNEFGESIMFNTEQYYCISRRDSLVTDKDFISFCGEMNLNFQEHYPPVVKKTSVDLCILDCRTFPKEFRIHSKT